jgi:Putative serine esterase (DUF676)
MRYRVTLVHGTFSKRAPWTQEGSYLRLALEKLLDGPIEFKCINWSGRNTAAARAKGAETLAEELRRQMEDDDPETKHFIVAHSHGGNVALYAMRDETISLRIAGIVTLATPFIVVSERFSLEGNDGLIIITGLGIYASILSYYLYIRFYTILFDQLAGEIIGAVFFIVLVVTAILLIRSLHGHSSELLQRLQLPSIDKSKLLILRSAGDEASIALLFSQFLALIPYRIFTFGLEIFDLFANFEKKHHLPTVFLRIIATIISGVLIAPILIIVWVSQNVFNMDLRSNNPFLNVTAEPTPRGNWDIHLFSKESERGPEIPHAQIVLFRSQQLQKNKRDPGNIFNKNTLIHSYLYSDWNALKTITTWMSNKHSH